MPVFISLMEVNSLQLYPADAAERLDFSQILQRLIQYCKGDLGEELILRQSFSTDPQWIQLSISRVKEFKDILENDNFFPEQGFFSLPFLSRASVEGAALSEVEFIRVAKFLQTFHDILNFFSQKKRAGLYPHLEELIQDVYWEKDIIAEILRVIDVEKEQVKESASAELARIRRQIMEIDREQQSVFGKVLRHYRQKDVLAEQEEGVRNGRRVLAVRAEYKRSVPGIYHDDSANGNIAFIEPQETVNLNNEIVSLLRDERREIERILRQLTGYIRPFIHHFEAYQEVLAEYDAIRAKAILAISLSASAPEISRDRKLQLLQFRHPILFWSHMQQHKPVIDNTLHLTEHERFLIISGPNAGGKSIVLKSVGLLQLMFQFGMLLPVAEGSRFPVFKKLFVDIGDEQSIENDLSTYSSHLRNMKVFTDQADEETLILLDELGHGTDPALGGAMAEAVLEHLLRKQAFACITTHYANLKAWGARTAGVQNAAMSFDRKNLEPLYQLHIGSPGSSFTFEIATKSGLSPDIIEAARKKAGEQNREMEQSLTEIQHEKQFIKGVRKNLQLREKQLEMLVNNYEQLKKELERDKKKLLRNLKEQALEEFNKASRELENLMRNWKEDKQDKEKFLEARKFIDQQRASLEQVEEAIPPTTTEVDQPSEIIVGSLVRLEDGVQTGEVIELRKNKAVVAFGNTITRVDLGKLIAVHQPAKKIFAVVADTKERMAARSGFDINLDIRGLSREEALVALENFLDKALLMGLKHVRIIHGRGTGVLRQIVHHYLKHYPATKSYGFEGHPGGGDGVTVVDLG
jgi:DNA mismatch repair protein MutS2